MDQEYIDNYYTIAAYNTTGAKQLTGWPQHPDKCFIHSLPQELFIKYISYSQELLDNNMISKSFMFSNIGYNVSDELFSIKDKSIDHINQQKYIISTIVKDINSRIHTPQIMWQPVINNIFLQNFLKTEISQIKLYTKQYLMLNASDYWFYYKIIEDLYIINKIDDNTLCELMGFPNTSIDFIDDQILKTGAKFVPNSEHILDYLYNKAETLIEKE